MGMFWGIMFDGNVWGDSIWWECLGDNVWYEFLVGNNHMICNISSLSGTFML